MSEYVCRENIDMKSGTRCQHWGEEIVRCRDCKHYQPKEAEFLSCRFVYKDFVQWRNAEPNGFCAWGERRDAK